MPEETRQEPPEDEKNAASQEPSGSCDEESEEEEAPEGQSMFRIISVDPKNTLDFEDVADK